MLRFYRTNNSPLSFRQKSLLSLSKFKNMKKLVLFASLTFSFAIYGVANNRVEIKTQSTQEETIKGSEKESKHYNFSLFRFVKTYSRQQPKQDSSKTLENLPPEVNPKDETTYHYEKPLTLFKFS